jgi:hypothetical protein
MSAGADEAATPSMEIVRVRLSFANVIGWSNQTLRRRSVTGGKVTRAPSSGLTKMMSAG